MEFHPREVEQTFKKWFNRREGVMLYGARQVGKSTLLKNIAGTYKQGRYLTFDEEATYNLFRENSQGALEQAVSLYNPVFIDEFQKVPSVTLGIKYLFDNREPKPKFFLSGSISDSLTKGGDSLVGRVIRIPLYTLSFSEYLQFRGIAVDLDFKLDDFDLSQIQFSFLEKGKLIEAEFENYLKWGGYPGTVGMERDQLTGFFRSLKAAFLEKDLLGRLRLDGVQNLSNLATILAKRVGFPLSLNNIANEIGVDIKTVKKLIDILKFGFWIDVVYSKAEYGSEFKNKFKVYYLDNGLRNFLAELGDNLNSFEEGPIFENCAYGIIRRYLSYEERKESIYFWHTYGGGEVDFIVGEKAFEIKAGKLSRPIVPLSLSNYIKRYKIKKAFVINKNFYGEKRVGGTLVYFLPLYVFGLIV